MDKEIIKLQNTKAAIKQALVDKGCNPTDEFASYADDIKALQTSGKIIEGTKFSCSTFKELPEYYKSYIEQQVDCSYMFQYVPLEGELELNLYNATNISDMFAGGTTSKGEKIQNKITRILINLNNPAAANRLLNNNIELESATINGTITEARAMFSDCSKLTNVSGNMDFSNTQDFGVMFARCKLLETIPNIDFSSATTMDYMFEDSGIKYLPKMNTINVTRLNGIISGCSKLERVEEIIVTNLNEGLGAGYLTNLRYYLIKGLGTQSGSRYLSFSNVSNWGVVNDKHPDARQSVIDSLITYSFDRATAGYNSGTLYLSSNTKSLLTEEEIAQITAKGFTIS